MKESTRKKLVFATLPAALIWAAFNLGGGQKETTPSDQYGPAAAAPATARPIVATPTDRIDFERYEGLEWAADPFRPTGRTTASPQRSGQQLVWILSGIVFNADRPMAFVNNRSVQPGDSVDGATVVAIDAKTVTLDYRGRTIVLKVNKG